MKTSVFLLSVFFLLVSSCTVTADYSNVIAKTKTYTQKIDDELNFEMISVITDDLITLGEDVESVTKKVYVSYFEASERRLIPPYVKQGGLKLARNFLK